jgi:methionyl-tRNA synthetase
MKNKKKFYVTTAIDYVNAKPHIGHAYEKVLADTICRWKKLNGEKVFLLTGTDENAQKNSQVAKEQGIPVKKFVDRNSKYFIDMCKVLNVDYDRFIRTTEKEHQKISQEIFKKVYDKGEIYKGKYEGLYCVGCEAFITEKDLIDGKCPEHKKEPDFVSEDAYFFKLSKYKNKLIKFIENYVVPDDKKNEILSRLKNEELKDLCVSRSNLDWGIDSPIDKNFKIYVWFDALINYYSGANGNWPADLHVVGKGINWFHSVIWPAILMSAEIELPKKLLVHSYLTVDGQKISKSLGNVIDPIELAKKYPVDSIRYALMKGTPFNDFDFSEKYLVEKHNNELANKLGNLVSRVSALAEKYGIEKLSKDDDNLLVYASQILDKEVKGVFDNFQFDRGINFLFEEIDNCNEYLQLNKPWESKDKKVLYEVTNMIKSISILLWPIIPETSEKIAKQFGFKISLKDLEKPLKITKIKKSEILFKKI